MARLKNLFNSLITATGKYDDLAKKIISNADDVARASGNIVELDDLMQVGNRPAKSLIEPITIGNYIKPDHSSLSLSDVRKMDARQSVQDILNSDGFKATVESAAKNAQNTFTLDQLEDGSWKPIAEGRLRSFYDRLTPYRKPSLLFNSAEDFHKQRLYDSAVSHGAIPDKLDRLLNTNRFNKPF